MKHPLFFRSLLVTVLAITACSTHEEFLPYSNLVGQGILPLSTTNPYLGANLFIGTEAQRSGYLFNFLKGRGGPMAIELEQDGIAAPPRLIMYYPHEREAFAAELQDFEARGARFREWVVRGPYQIERRDFRELARLESTFVGDPVFMVRGKAQRFIVQPEVTKEETRTVLVPAVPTPRPTPRPIIKKSKSESQAAKPAEDFKPLNSDQQALRIAKGFVERTENGDAVHTVTDDKQTISELAKWYAGSEKLAVAVAHANGLELNAALTLGQRIVIPKGLLTNEKAFGSK